MAYIKKINREARDAVIIASYNITRSVLATSIETGVSESTCRRVLAKAGVLETITPVRKIHQYPTSKQTEMYTRSGEYVRSFESLSQAARYLRDTSEYTNAAPSIICAALHGERPTAYGYKWKFATTEDI